MKDASSFRGWSQNYAVASIVLALVYMALGLEDFKNLGFLGILVLVPALTMGGSLRFVLLGVGFLASPLLFTSLPQYEPAAVDAIIALAPIFIWTVTSYSFAYAHESENKAEFNLAGLLTALMASTHATVLWAFMSQETTLTFWIVQLIQLAILIIFVLDLHIWKKLSLGVRFALFAFGFQLWMVTQYAYLSI